MTIKPKKIGAWFILSNLIPLGAAIINSTQSEPKLMWGLNSFWTLYVLILLIEAGIVFLVFLVAFCIHILEE